MSRGPERGAVTAELALGLPLLLAVTVGLVWLLAAATAQVRVVDAAREAARVAARGDGIEAAQEVGRRIAPEGAELSVRLSGGEVRVEASARIEGPGGLFDFLPGVTVRSSAVAVSEEDG
ncbi:TadE family type IV pilus minor pilin [Nocardioides sp. P5_C9_2]